MKRVIPSFTIGLLVLLSCLPLRADQMIPLPIAKLSARADLILHGTVTSSTVRRDPAGRIYTTVDLKVEDDNLPPPLEVKSNAYSVGKEKLQAVSASASRDQNGVIHISLVNIDAKQVQDVVIDIRGAKFNAVTGRILTSGKLQDHNTFEKPDAVRPDAFKDAYLTSNTMKVRLPPFSVVVLELK